MPTKNDKLAVIMSGDGTRSSFGVGVLLALAEKYGITEPFLLICGSGSAGTGSYYLAKQYASIRNIWTNLVSSRKFLNRWRFWKVIDIDYLIDVIFKRQDPLDGAAVRKSKTRYLIPALNKTTGKIDYFDNKSGMDVFESMRATKAMPLAFKLNPSIGINGSAYCDSLLSSNSRAHVKKAVEMGADKILLIHNTHPGEARLERAFFSLWMLFRGCKRNYYATERELLGYRPPENVSVFSIRPKSQLEITTLNNRKSLLKGTINVGYSETVSNDELRSFLA